MFLFSFIKQNRYRVVFFAFKIKTIICACVCKIFINNTAGNSGNYITFSATARCLVFNTSGIKLVAIKSVRYVIFLLKCMYFVQFKIVITLHWNSLSVDSLASLNQGFQLYFMQNWSHHWTTPAGPSKLYIQQRGHWTFEVFLISIRKFI